MKSSQLFVEYFVSNLSLSSSPTATPPLVTVETIFAPLGLTCSLVLGHSAGGAVVVVGAGVVVVVVTKVHEWSLRPPLVGVFHFGLLLPRHSTFQNPFGSAASDDTHGALH